MTIGTISPADKARLQHLVTDGIQAMTDIAAIKESLKETIESIAEELEIKKNVLNKAIKVAYKNSLNKDEIKDSREVLDEVEEILHAANKT